VNRDSEPTSLRCSACGLDIEETRETDTLARTYQVVVACAQCRTPFVVLSRN